MRQIVKRWQRSNRDARGPLSARHISHREHVVERGRRCVPLAAVHSTTTSLTGEPGTPLSPTSGQQVGSKPVHILIPTTTARLLRSWTKGVEVLLSWDLQTAEPFNPNNDKHIGRLAEFYCNLNFQIGRRMEVLMGRWRAHKTLEPEEKEEKEEIMDGMMDPVVGAEVPGCVPGAVGWVRGHCVRLRDLCEG